MTNEARAHEVGKQDNDSTSSQTDLGKALAAFVEDMDTWSGVPATQNLAEALSVVRAAYLAATGERHAPAFRNYLGEAMRGPEYVQRGNIIALIDALMAALKNETGDGWKLRLSGKKGPRRTSDDFDEELKIAAYVRERIQAGGGYDSAVVAAADQFQCRNTKIKDAYSEYGWFTEYLEKLEEKDPKLASKILTLARASPR